MYEFNNRIKLNMSAFDEAVSNYCYCESDFRTYAKRYSEIRYTKEYFDHKERIESDYWRKSAESDSAWYALRVLCNLVGLDALSVLRVYKSIRRNAQYQNAWKKEAHFSDNRYFEFERKKTGSIESFCDACRA